MNSSSFGFLPSWRPRTAIPNTSLTGKEDDMPTFELWLAELDALAAAEGCDTPYTQQTGPECWRESYDDGMTPAEAWAEEKYYGAQDVA